MPRIDAPSVAEHHRRRREALLNAGLQILADGGAGAVTPAAVGAAAGIARSSVYQYFDSTQALLAAIVDDAFPLAFAALQDAVDREPDPQRRVDAYLATALALATDPTHRAFDAMNAADFDPELRARVDVMHREQYAPLLDALDAVGATEPRLAAQLIGGMLTSAARAVTTGENRDDVLAALLAAVHHGVVPHE